MTVLDASCLIGLLLDEPGADKVQRLLSMGTCQLSVLNRAEIVEVLTRRGADREAVSAGLDVLGLDDVDVTRVISDSAAQPRSGATTG